MADRIAAAFKAAAADTEQQRRHGRVPSLNCLSDPIKMASEWFLGNRRAAFALRHFGHTSRNLLRPERLWR
jgi:hypothetical protein